MARVIFAAAADADSAGIIEDLESKAGRLTALKFSKLFDNAYDRLYPESGALRPAVERNIRISSSPE